MTPQERFGKAQAQAQAASQALLDFQAQLRARYPSGYYPNRHARELVRLRKAAGRAWDALWVQVKRSPWDWGACSCRWLIHHLTWELLTAPEAPTVPAEAASYGWPAAPRRLDRRS